jgi:cyclic-di-GMP phosphodiesterase TipF (flagellum assembly factor)
LPAPAQPRAAAPAAPQAPSRPAPAPQQSRAPREADVEVIQDAIKRLLEEVNAAEQQEARAQQTAGAAPPPLPSRSRSAPDASVERSIDALRMTAGSMRSALGGHEATHLAQRDAAPPPLPPFVRGAPQPRPASPSDARARLMADAISAGRIDVALEPILGLEDQQTRHYEVSVRLRDADGNPLEVSDGGLDLRGTGLLPLFDGVRITRTAAVARRLEERGKGGSVFSSFSGESVADEHFLGELAETLHQRASLASQLVLSFTQSDVRGFSTPEWDSLADMRSLGFRFALSAITDLDMDFEALAEQGFVFVKLDASVFLEGLPAPSGRLPSSDVCRHLAQHGLTLVVGRIDNDDQLARVFGFGVLLGQGQLFGGARPVRADVVASRARTVAAE